MAIWQPQKEAITNALKIQDHDKGCNADVHDNGNVEDEDDVYSSVTNILSLTAIIEVLSL